MDWEWLLHHGGQHNQSEAAGLESVPMDPRIHNQLDWEWLLVDAYPGTNHNQMVD